MAGLEDCRGEVTLGGKNWPDMPLKDREVCYTFGRDSLDRKKSAAENIVKPLILRGAGREAIKEASKRAARLADAGDIPAAKVKGRPPYDIAKLILARTFVRKPAPLSLYEPLR